MASIRYEIWIDAPVSRVYELLSTAAGISMWWDPQTERRTEAGRVLEHTPGPEHGTVQFLVLESGPELVRWKCISEHPPQVPASDWTGTEMAFALGQRDSSHIANQAWATKMPVQTVLKFKHSGWSADSQYLPFCSFAWAAVLGNLSKTASTSEPG